MDKPFRRARAEVPTGRNYAREFARAASCRPRRGAASRISRIGKLDLTQFRGNGAAVVTIAATRVFGGTALRVFPPAVTVDRPPLTLRRNAWIMRSAADAARSAVPHRHDVQHVHHFRHPAAAGAVRPIGAVPTLSAIHRR
jgi:hypothetical protein